MTDGTFDDSNPMKNEDPQTDVILEEYLGNYLTNALRLLYIPLRLMVLHRLDSGNTSLFEVGVESSVYMDLEK